VKRSTNDSADIRALFTQDAAWRGHDEIVRQWLDRKDEPGQAEFRWHLLTVTPEVAVVQGRPATPPRATPTLTCGSSAWTPRAVALSS